MELFKASAQWATRPADERFATISSLYDATKAYANAAQEKTINVADLRTEAVGSDVRLTGKQNNPAHLTHWAFGQLCARLGAPASYMRDLPATLACQNLNYGLAQLSKVEGDTEQKRANLLFHANGHLLLRAFTSEKYSRIWNYEVAERLLHLQQHGWQPAVPDKRFDGGNPAECQVCNGTGKGFEIGAPVGFGDCVTCKGTGKALPALYASDHDMFAFVRNNSVVIREPGNPDGLQRGVIVENSEVGASALKLTRFLYREMCGNFIVWGASRVLEIAVRHVGDARDRFSHYYGEIRRYAESGAAADEAKIDAARKVYIADTKEGVLDKLFGMRQLGLSRKALEAGYDAVNRDQDGDPNSVWGIVQGLTRSSQKTAFADQRFTIDRAAGKIMEANF